MGCVNIKARLSSPSQLLSIIEILGSGILKY